MDTPEIKRRHALGLGAVAVGMPLLAGCADDGGAGAGSTGSAGAPGGTSSGTGSAPPEAELDDDTEDEREDETEDGREGSESENQAAPAPSVDVLTPTADVPEGGGLIFAAEQVVVTQPRAGEFKCFSAVCTHQGCVVSAVTASIVCGCHGSEFSLADGSVERGPADQPLPERKISVVDGSISLA